jgi:hypothetical protein
LKAQNEKPQRLPMIDREQRGEAPGEWNDFGR